MTPNSPSAPFQHLTLTVTEGQYSAVFDALLNHCAELEHDVEAGYVSADELQATREVFEALVQAGTAAGFEDDIVEL